MIERPWLVVGVTVRALAQAAARHGHAVCAIDAFADRDLLDACAGRVVRLETRDDWSLDPQDLARALAEAQRRFGQDGFCGVVAGSGFDSDAALRAQLDRCAPLFGCDAHTIAALRDPRAWDALLTRLGIAHPPTRFAPPADARGWLIKAAGGSGGWHVQRWRAGAALGADTYFQRRMPGRPASVLFAADGREAQIVGWQWQLLDPTSALPWRYGGVVGAPDLSVAVKATITGALTRLVDALPIRGLASLDFLVAGDTAQVLELNPRPTASTALYPDRDLFGLHVRASVGAMRESDASPQPNAGASESPTTRSAIHANPEQDALPHTGIVHGEAVVFAAHALCVPEGFPWPSYCSDLPARACEFDSGDPVCTVHADAPTPRAARALLAQRRSTVTRLLQRQDTHELDIPQRQRACATDRPGPAC